MAKFKFKPLLQMSGIQFVGCTESNFSVRQLAVLHAQAKEMQNVIDASVYKDLVVPVVRLEIDGTIVLEWLWTFDVYLFARPMTKWVQHRVDNIYKKNRVKSGVLSTMLHELCIYKREGEFNWRYYETDAVFENDHTGAYHHAL